MWCKISWSKRMFRAACAEIEDRRHEYRHMTLGPAGAEMLRLNADRVHKLNRLGEYLVRRMNR